MGNCLNVTTNPAPDCAPDAESLPPAAHKRRRLISIFSAPILPPSTPSDLSSLYQLGPQLGCGQSGVIRLCIEKSSGLEFACKSIPKLRLCTQRQVEDVVAEIEIMKVLSGHPNIVQLHFVVEDRAFVHLIMELCKGGELFDRLVRKGRYSEAEAAPVMKTLMETVHFCHDKGIVHRDLKPENILLADATEFSSIKLADFGLARHFSPGQRFTGITGSSYYMAPEVLQGSQEYGREVDVWSGGVILYILLSGVPPFWGESEQEISQRIKEGKLDFTSDPWDTVSESAKDLIANMLCLDVNARFTPAQVLGHPWISEYSRGPLHTEEFPVVPDCEIEVVRVVKSPDTSQKKAPSGTHALPVLQQPATVKDLALECLDTITQKCRFNGFLLSLINKLEDMLVLSLSSNPVSMELPNGWSCSCTFLTNTASEQRLVVLLGQRRYLVVNDRVHKRIGWKVYNENWVEGVYYPPSHTM